MSNELVEIQKTQEKTLSQLRRMSLYQSIDDFHINKNLEQLIGTNHKIKETLCGIATIDSMMLAVQSSTNSKLDKALTSLSAIEGGIETVSNQLSVLGNNAREIINVLKTPMETVALEHFQRGLERMKKGFLEEAADSFLKAIEENITNYLPHFYLGVIYYMGKDEDDDMVDYDKAEEQFRLAIKYAKPDNVKPFLVDSCKYLSDISYIRATQNNNGKKELFDKAYDLIKTALEFDYSDTTKLMLTQRFVRCANRCNDTKSAIDYAYFSLKHDASFLTLLLDPEIKNLFPLLETTIKTITIELRESYVDYILNKDDSQKEKKLKQINEIVPKSELSTYSGMMLVTRIINPSEKND